MAQSWDLLSDTEARQVLGMGTADASKGTALARAVSAVSNRLAEACGTIVYGTVTDYFDGGCSRVWLRQPVAQVNTVVEYDNTTAATLTAESNTSKPTTGYYLGTINGELVRRDGNVDSYFPRGRNNVLVTYVVGRAANTAAVPERFKEAAAVTLKNWWRMYEAGAGRVNEYDVPQASFPTFAVPKAAKELLADEWRTGSGIGD